MTLKIKYITLAVMQVLLPAVGYTVLFCRQPYRHYRYPRWRITILTPHSYRTTLTRWPIFRILKRAIAAPGKYHVDIYLNKQLVSTEDVNFKAAKAAVMIPGWRRALPPRAWNRWGSIPKPSRPGEAGAGAVCPLPPYRNPPPSSTLSISS